MREWLKWQWKMLRCDHPKEARDYRMHNMGLNKGVYCTKCDKLMYVI
jgi:hypothetical protein